MIRGNKIRLILGPTVTPVVSVEVINNPPLIMLILFGGHN